MNLLRSTLLILAAAAAPAALPGAQGFAVTDTAQLVRFDLSNPGVALSSVALTGFVQSDGVTPDAFGNLYDLARRGPAGAFYGLDVHGNFYTVNPATGALNLVSNTFAPTGFDGGLAYDPFFSGFRFVSDARENALLAPNGAVTLGNLVRFAAGDPNELLSPHLVALGIDPDFGTGYAVDSDQDVLVTTIDPNFEEFFTTGPLGVNITGLAALDVDSLGTIYATLSEDAFTSAFYTIDPFSGAATFVGNFGYGVTAFAVPEPAEYGLLAGALALLTLWRRRQLC